MILNNEQLKSEYEKDARLSTVFKIYDMVDNKNEYKEIIKFVKNTYKTFKKYYNSGDRFSQEIHRDINESLTVISIIENFDPLIENLEEYDMEASISISDTNGNAITAHGAGHKGGCTLEEVKEFLDILKVGLKEFTKEG